MTMFYRAMGDRYSQFLTGWLDATATTVATTITSNSSSMFISEARQPVRVTDETALRQYVETYQEIGPVNDGWFEVAPGLQYKLPHVAQPSFLAPQPPKIDLTLRTQPVVDEYVRGPSGRLYGIGARIYQYDGLGKISKSTCWAVDGQGDAHTLPKCDKVWSMRLALEMDEARVLKEFPWRDGS